MQNLKPKRHSVHGFFLAIGGTKCAVDNHTTEVVQLDMK